MFYLKKKNFHSYAHLHGLKVSDLKQELFQLRKSENNMILKYKRLNSNHGSYIFPDCLVLHVISMQTNTYLCIIIVLL